VLFGFGPATSAGTLTCLFIGESRYHSGTSTGPGWGGGGGGGGPNTRIDACTGKQANGLAYTGEHVRCSGVLILEERHADTHFAPAAVLDIPLQRMDARSCKLVAHFEFHNPRK
jgi:hypothetical protein